jgi:PAS domain S-box-containing protein
MPADVIAHAPSRIADFIDEHRDEVVQLYRARARGRPVADAAEGMSTLPLFLSALARRLRHEDGRILETVLDSHVEDRLRHGLGLEEVVNEISMVGPCVLELWSAAHPASPADPGEVSQVFQELQHVSAHAAARLTEHFIEDELSDKRYARLLEHVAAEALVEGPQRRPLRDRCDEIVRAVLSNAVADAAALFLRWGDDESLELVSSLGAWDEDLFEDTRRLRPGSFPAAVVTSAEPRALAPPELRGAERGGVRAVLGARLWARDRLLGVLLVGFQEERPFPPRELWRLETLAGRLALVLDEARLWERLRSQNERLRDTEERFRLLVDNVKDYAIFMLGPDGTIESWNQGAARFTGYPADEVIGKNFGMMYPPEDQALGKARRALDEAIAHGRYEEEGRRVAKSGRSYWSSVVLTPVFGADGQLRGFTKVARDISERRRAEALMRENDARLRLAVAIAEIGTWSYTPSTKEVTWDERTRALWGLPADAPVNYEAFLAGLHPEDRPQVEATVERIFGPGGPGVLKDEYRTLGIADGVERWIAVQGRVVVDEVGQPVRVLGVVREITETKRIMQALHDREQQLRKAEEVTAVAAELAGFHTYEYWPQSGKVVLSAEARRHFGFTPDQPVDLALVLRAIHPADREGVKRALEAAMRAENGGDYVAEYRATGLDRKERWLQMRGRVFFDEQRRPLRLVGGGIDITDRKRLDELRERLFGIVGHDLRNPLNAIKMASENLARNLPPQYRNTAGMIIRSVDRMSKMIHQLLDFTRVRFAAGLQLERERVDLAGVCRDVIAETELAHPERQVTFFAAGDGTGLWDRSRLAEVLSNLLGDAIQHGAPDLPIDVTLTAATEEVLIEVHNQGPPIPPEILPVVFDHFRGTGGGKTASSLGLGLYISREIVRAHGGEIEISSSAEVGTIATMRLPRG